MLQTGEGQLRSSLLSTWKFFHHIGCVLENHNIVDRHIDNSVLEIHIPLIGQHIGFLDVIVIIYQELIHCVVLKKVYLNDKKCDLLSQKLLIARDSLFRKFLHHLLRHGHTLRIA